MSDNCEEFLMVSLHKLAAERGDGLIPELMALHAARDRKAVKGGARNSDVVSTDQAGNDNVIAFRPYLVAKRKKG